jgi:hypothetical protein
MCVNPKYNIEDRLRKLPGRYQHKKYELAILVDKSERTIDYWLNVKTGDSFSIPSDELIKISNFFKCSITDLING